MKGICILFLLSKDIRIFFNQGMIEKVEAKSVTCLDNPAFWLERKFLTL